jgi:hypothetical protein
MADLAAAVSRAANARRAAPIRCTMGDASGLSAIDCSVDRLSKRVSARSKAS